MSFDSTMKSGDCFDGSRLRWIKSLKNENHGCYPRTWTFICFGKRNYFSSSNGSCVRSKTQTEERRTIQCLSEVASTVKEVQILSNALYKKINFPVSVVYISLYRLPVILSIRLFVSVSLWWGLQRIDTTDILVVSQGIVSRTCSKHDHGERKIFGFSGVFTMETLTTMITIFAVKDRKRIRGGKRTKYHETQLDVKFQRYFRWNR